MVPDTTSLENFHQSLNQRKLKRLFSPSQWDKTLDVIHGILLLLFLLLFMVSTYVIAQFFVESFSQFFTNTAGYVTYTHFISKIISGLLVIVFLVFVLYLSGKHNERMQKLDQQLRKGNLSKLFFVQRYTLNRWIYRQMEEVIDLLTYLAKNTPVVIEVPKTKDEQKYFFSKHTQLKTYTNLNTLLSKALEQLDITQQKEQNINMQHEITSYTITNNTLILTILTQYASNNVILTAPSTLHIDIYHYIQAKRVFNDK